MGDRRHVAKAGELHHTDIRQHREQGARHRVRRFRRCTAVTFCSSFSVSI